MEKNNKPDVLFIDFGLEVDRLIKNSKLTTRWVRRESHFCNDTFNELKKGNLNRLNFVKVIHLTRCLFKGNPKLFCRWYLDYFWRLMSGSDRALKADSNPHKMLC